MRRILFLFLIFTTLSCGQKNSPKGVADKFLFRYFIELNQRGALELATGLARQKLQKEIELTQSVRMQPDLDLNAQKPFIDYKLVNTQQRDGTSATLYYDVSIETKAGGHQKREAVISVVQVDNRWKVSNYDIFNRNQPN